MAKKIGAPSPLSIFEPSAEELAAARAVLASCDEKKKKSVANAMCAYVKTNDGGDSAILTTRGDDRQDYMVRYLACQSRKTKAKVKNVSETLIVKERVLETIPMCRAEMRKTYGRNKANAMIASPRCRPRQGPSRSRGQRPSAGLLSHPFGRRERT